MGIDEGTGDTVRSDQADIGSEGAARETASDAAADVTQEGEAEAGVVASSGDSDLIQKPAQEDAEVDAKKKKKKKDTGLGSSRGIETMFRTSYRVHQDLASLADTKANIMISVNGFIIAITIPFVTSQMDRPIAGAPLYEWLSPLAAGVLLIGCVTALVYAILAARPRVSNVPRLGWPPRRRARPRPTMRPGRPSG